MNASSNAASAPATHFFDVSGAAETLIFAPPDLAPVTKLGAIPTTKGMSPKMIVSRMQDHIIETSDGDLHLMVNMGLGQGTVIMTSTDSGVTWERSMLIGQHGIGSSADIRMVLDGDTAAVVFSTDAGEIVFWRLEYDTEANTWTSRTQQVVANGVESSGISHPTIAVSDRGLVLVAYTETTDAGLEINFAYSDDGGYTWTNTQIDVLDAEAGAARVLATTSGFGVLYATSDGIFWAGYTPATSSWSYEEVYSGGAIGKYATHFSTVEVGDSTYVAVVDPDLTLILLEYDALSRSWSEALVFEDSAGSVSSVQISAEDDGRLYLTYDDTETGELYVLESLDHGDTWVTVATLDVPFFFDPGPVRFEVPEYFDDEMVIVMQVNLAFTDKFSMLYSWSVDLADPASEQVLAEAEQADAPSEILDYLL
ncbi:sialidase family protein [Roseivivax sp. CAU 1753]